MTDAATEAEVEDAELRGGPAPWADRFYSVPREAQVVRVTIEGGGTGDYERCRCPCPDEPRHFHYRGDTP